MKPATLAAALVLVAAIAAFPAAAASLRAPQVPVLGGTLDAYLAGVGESINVDADQLDITTWKSSVSGNVTATLQVSLGGSVGDELGLYEAHSHTTRYPIFKDTDALGSFAIVSLRSSAPKLIINVFDVLGQHQRRDPVNDFETTNFGFYIKSGSAVGHTEDNHNLNGLPSVLTYAGTGDNAGCWWLCFDRDRSAPGDEGSDFDDATMFLESLNPTPVTKSTWAAVKARFR